MPGWREPLTLKAHDSLKHVTTADNADELALIGDGNTAKRPLLDAVTKIKQVTADIKMNQIFRHQVSDLHRCRLLVLPG